MAQMQMDIVIIVSIITNSLKRILIQNLVKKHLLGPNMIE